MLWLWGLQKKYVYLFIYLFIYSGLLPYALSHTPTVSVETPRFRVPNPVFAYGFLSHTHALAVSVPIARGLPLLSRFPPNYAAPESIAVVCFPEPKPGPGL